MMDFERLQFVCLKISISWIRN